MEEACLHLRKVAESEWRAARLNLPLQLYKWSTAVAAAATRSCLHCKHTDTGARGQPRVSAVEPVRSEIKAETSHDILMPRARLEYSYTT